MFYEYVDSITLALTQSEVNSVLILCALLFLGFIAYHVSGGVSAFKGYLNKGNVEEFYGLKTAMFDNALNAFIVVTLDGRVKLWNATAERMFLYTYEDAKDRILADLIVPLEYRARHVEGMQRYKETGISALVDNPEGTKMKAQRHDGKLIDIRLFLKRIELSGRVYVGGFVVDKTQETKLISELQDKVKLCELGENLTNTGAWFWDMTKSPDEVTYLDEFARIFDIQKGQVVTAEFLMSSVHIDDREHVNKTMKLSLDSGKRYVVNYRLPKRNSTVDLIECIGQPILNKNGKVIKIYGTVRVLQKDIE